jgi:cytochrome c oxidase cbb3-type subunit I/II
MTTHRPLFAVSLALASWLAFPSAAAAADDKPVPIDEALAKKGEVVYARWCVSCHGQLGDGRGYSAQWLEPRPRDFTSGIFKCRSTPSGTLPTNDDLIRTLTVGLYHTYMPPWAVIGVPQMRAVTEYLKTFSSKWKEEAPGVSITIPTEPANDDASRKRGRTIWKNNQCEKCHGPEGKGNGASAPTLRDDWGFPDQPFNFAASDKRKCGTTNADLYRTFMTGVNGSPMPSFGDSISPQDAWDLVHYVLSLQAPPDSEYPIAEHF